MLQHDSPSVDGPAMVRPFRLEFPHAICHVTSRGNARQRIVTTDADRQAWLAVLGQVIGRCGGFPILSLSRSGEKKETC